MSGSRGDGEVDGASLLDKTFHDHFMYPTKHARIESQFNFLHAILDDACLTQ